MQPFAYDSNRDTYSLNNWTTLRIHSPNHSFAGLAITFLSISESHSKKEEQVISSMQLQTVNLRIVTYFRRYLRAASAFFFCFPRILSAFTLPIIKLRNNISAKKLLENNEGLLWLVKVMVVSGQNRIVELIGHQYLIFEFVIQAIFCITTLRLTSTLYNHYWNIFFPYDRWYGLKNKGIDNHLQK